MIYLSFDIDVLDFFLVLSIGIFVFGGFFIREGNYICEEFVVIGNKIVLFIEREFCYKVRIVKFMFILLFCRLIDMCGYSRSKFKFGK